jgi:hypothetical protein
MFEDYDKIIDLCDKKAFQEIVDNYLFRTFYWRFSYVESAFKMSKLLELVFVKFIFKRLAYDDQFYSLLGQIQPITDPVINSYFKAFWINI